MAGGADQASTGQERPADREARSAGRLHRAADHKAVQQPARCASDLRDGRVERGLVHRRRRHRAQRGRAGPGGQLRGTAAQRPHGGGGTMNTPRALAAMLRQQQAVAPTRVC